MSPNGEMIKLEGPSIVYHFAFGNELLPMKEIASCLGMSKIFPRKSSIDEWMLNTLLLYPKTSIALEFMPNAAQKQSHCELVQWLSCQLR